MGYQGNHGNLRSMNLELIMIIKKITKKSLEEAVGILKNGGVVVYPTDTIYGLGADIFNKKAVKKVYQIKGRKFNKPLLILADSKKEIGKFVYLNTSAKKAISEFLPGPLTLILKKGRLVPEVITGGRETVGIRLPRNKIATALAKKLGRPITTTSANLAGRKTPATGGAIFNHFKSKKYQPDLILDAGKLENKPSTILDLSGKGGKIIRRGRGVKKVKEFLDK